MEWAPDRRTIGRLASIPRRATARTDSIGARIARTLSHASHDASKLDMQGKAMSKKKWVQDVKTVSTFPPEDTFTKSAATIARVMGSKKVSPKGLGSAIRMIQYFINRSGKNLPARRKRELEEAKHILQEKSRRQKERAR
jgi:hypothetical protein